MSNIEENYLDIIKERAAKSHVYKKYQLTGLTISQLLNDESHKSLYIKLAMQYNNNRLMEIAKDISERKNIENKGGYFMVMLKTKLPPKSQKIKTKKSIQTN